LVSRIRIVLLNRLTLDHSSESDSSSRKPVLRRKTTISPIHSGLLSRIIFSSSLVIHLSLSLFSLSFGTFEAGLSLSYSHSLTARFNAFVNIDSSLLTLAGAAPSLFLKTLYRDIIFEDIDNKPDSQKYGFRCFNYVA